jgi:AraC-like DNA-binding protein
MTELVYARFEGNPLRKKVKPHTHPLWQIELVYSGDPTLILKDKTTILKKGDIVIIPPGVKHGFLYSDSKTEWFTLRFSNKTFHSFDCIIEHNGLFEEFKKICRKEQKGLQPFLSQTIEHLISALLTYTLGRIQGTIVKPLGFIEKIKSFLKKNSHTALTTQDISKHLGFSISYTRSLFKSLTGDSLKNHIDQARFSEAKNLLQYSDYSIGEIASLLSFTDIYSFSRFVKRISKSTPRGIRAKFFKL